MNLLRFVGRDAERAEHIRAESLATHEHSHGAGVQSLAKILKDDRHHDIAHRHSTVGHRIDASDLLKNLVVHGEGSPTNRGVGNAIPPTSHVFGLEVDSVGLTVRNDHDGRNLNLFVGHPLLHELASDHHGLHGRSRTKREHAIPHLHDNGLVEKGEEPFTLGRIVRRGCQLNQLAPTVHQAVRTKIHKLGSVLRLVGAVVALRNHCAESLRINPATLAHHAHFGETKHLKGNLRLLAEPNQLKNLKEAIRNGVPHRTAAIKEEADPVVLAVLLDDLRQEDIVMRPVLVQAVKVEHPGLLGTLTPDLVSRLATLKLGNQLANEGIGILHELPVGGDGEREVRLLLKLRKKIVGRDDLIRNILNRRNGERGRGESFTRLANEPTLHVDHAKPFGLLLATLGIGRIALAGTILLLLLVLLPHLVHRRMLVESLRQLESLVKGLHRVDQVRNALLLVRKIHIQKAGNAPLEVNVHAVDESDLRNVHLAELEQVAVHDLLVAQEEVPTSTGVLRLHHLLDADIFDDIADAVQQLGDEPISLRLLHQLLATLVGSPQGMADLVSHEHGLKGVGDIPHGHDEVAGLDIERCRGSLRVKGERKVFGGESAGEDGERGVHAVILPQVRGQVKRNGKSFLRPVTFELVRGGLLSGTIQK